MAQVLDYIIGPQLLGVIFLLAGTIQKYFPPKKINALYGYRTPASTQNQQTWDEANRYSSNYMIKAGLVCLVIGIVLLLILQSISLSATLKGIITFISVLAAAMAPTLLMLTSTERHLAEKFDQQ